MIFAAVDIDGFREVNDTLGRAGGDAVLINIPEHLRAGLPPEAQLGRFEEDEFAVVMTGDDARAADLLVGILRTSLQRPIFVDRMWQITASIGIAQAPEDGTTADELERAAPASRCGPPNAKAAAGRGVFSRRSKSNTRSGAFCCASFSRRFRSRCSTFTISRWSPRKAAPLSAWRRCCAGPIRCAARSCPRCFIPLAEQSGLMSQLGEIVLRRALADGARWPGLTVAGIFAVRFATAGWSILSVPSCPKPASARRAWFWK